MRRFAKLLSTVTGAPRTERPPTPGSTITRDVLSSGRMSDARPVVDIDIDDPEDARLADRFVPLRTRTVLSTASGKRLDARIINISATGVAVEADFSQVGAETITMAGSRPVTLRRRIALGAAFRFARPIDPKLCGPDLIL